MYIYIYICIHTNTGTESIREKKADKIEKKEKRSACISTRVRKGDRGASKNVVKRLQFAIYTTTVKPGRAVGFIYGTYGVDL